MTGLATAAGITINDVATTDPSASLKSRLRYASPGFLEKVNNRTASYAKCLYTGTHENQRLVNEASEEDRARCQEISLSNWASSCDVCRKASFGTRLAMWAGSIGSEPDGGTIENEIPGDRLY